MTQPYGGQQPGEQPGGNHPGSNHPGSGGFPSAPGYQQGLGGMPSAPQERGGGPVPRPGATTAAAVLAFVQGGITLITTGILMIGLAALENLEDDASAGGVEIEGGLGEAWVVTIVQLIGVGLLVWGGVKLLSGTAGTLFLIAVGLQIALCLYWLARGAAPLVPVVLVVMPIIALVMALGQANKEYVRSRSGAAQH